MLGFKPSEATSSMNPPAALRSEQQDKSYGSRSLPIDYEPSAYTVILGRGKRCTEACGNRRLRVTAMMYLDRYTKASSKEAKSEVVSEIQRTVRASCPDKKGAFVRNCDGRWVEVDSVDAREKIGQVLRDLLSHKYRSSVKNKVAIRRERRLAARSEYEDSSSEFSVSRDMFTSHEDSSSELSVSRDMFMY